MTTVTTRGHGRRFAKAAIALAGAAALTCGTAVAADAPKGSNPPGVHVLNGDSKNSKHVDCPVGWMCFYDGVDFTYGAIAVLPGTEVSDVERLRLTDGGTFTGQEGISAWVNNSPVRYCWFPKKGFEGGSNEIASFAKKGDLPSHPVKSFKPC